MRNKAMPNTTSREKVLDNLAQFAGGTVSLASGIASNIRAEIKTRVDEAITRLDLVPREDFNRLEEMLQQSRIEQENLKARIENLEKKKK